MEIDHNAFPVIIRNAREQMCKAFKADEDFRQTYVANIAMLLHDRYDIIDWEKRNKAAEDIMDLIFCSQGGGEEHDS